MNFFTLDKGPHSKIGIALLQRKTWNLLRYYHARNALEWILESKYGKVESVLVIGCGTGIAEILLALEFPNINFTLTDWEGAEHTTKQAKFFQKEFNIQNITWSTLNILDPSEEKLYDLVYSVEVLEHIEKDNLAAENMDKLSKNFIFVLVPFAEESVNQNPRRRQRAWEKCEHYLCGYNPGRLFNLFPNIVKICGCYWKSGYEFRTKLTSMLPEEINNKAYELFEEGESDLINKIPRNLKDAAGIWIISSKADINLQKP